MIISKQLIDKAYTYEAYKALVEKLWKEGKNSGPVQSEELYHYTELNLHRMNRVEKTTIITEDLKHVLNKISSPQIWLIIAEGWCGDAAQSVPVFNLLEGSYPNIHVKILFRDENLELMDQFLTNGSRSIPKVIMLDADTLEVKAVWGPQPQEALQLIQALKVSQMEKAQIKEKLHLWYAKNKGMALQAEITTLLSNLVK
jgi:hypothetical protein